MSRKKRWPIADIAPAARLALLGYKDRVAARVRGSQRCAVAGPDSIIRFTGRLSQNWPTWCRSSTSIIAAIVVAAGMILPLGTWPNGVTTAKPFKRWYARSANRVLGPIPVNAVQLRSHTSFFCGAHRLAFAQRSAPVRTNGQGY
jgi:hypothetical protein